MIGARIERNSRRKKSRASVSITSEERERAFDSPTIISHAKKKRRRKNTSSIRVKSKRRFGGENRRKSSLRGFLAPTQRPARRVYKNSKRESRRSSFLRCPIGLPLGDELIARVSNDIKLKTAKNILLARALVTDRVSPATRAKTRLRGRREVEQRQGDQTATKFGNRRSVKQVLCRVVSRVCIADA